MLSGTVEPQSYVPLGERGIRNSEMYLTLNMTKMLNYCAFSMTKGAFNGVH